MTERQASDIIIQCKAACAAADVPFHADALAAAFGMPYEEFCAMAAGHGVTAKTAAVLTAALQECTAAVVASALDADPKAHAMWMFYLRNRAGFLDKGERSAAPTEAAGVTFIGEERI